MREQLRELLASVRELLVLPTFPRHSSETTEWTVETVESREWNTELTACSRAEAAATQISDAASAVAPSSTPSIAAPCFGSFTRESGLDICTAIFVHFLSLCIPKTFKSSSVADYDCDLSSRY